MLEDLLRHEKLGNRQELLFFLFDGLSVGRSQSLVNVRKYCASKVFTISRNFEGIIMFLQFLSFIEITENVIQFNQICFSPDKFDKQSYLSQFHLYEHMFHSLKNECVLKEIFNSDDLKFNPALSQFYVLDNRFPLKYFPLRNVLLATGFFLRNEDITNHLYIKKEFTDEFREVVASEISDKNKFFIKISLEQLKQSLKVKEDFGKLAEKFVLEFEHQRLNQHPNREKIEIISEDYSNAGYDIESFEAIDSILFDRFIEVKSYEGETSFFWSKNEIEKARELKEKYFLYLVNRLKIDESSYKPQIIQNPYSWIIENDFWKKEPVNWKVTLE